MLQDGCQDCIWQITELVLGLIVVLLLDCVKLVIWQMPCTTRTEQGQAVTKPAGSTWGT